MEMLIGQLSSRMIKLFVDFTINVWLCNVQPLLAIRDEIWQWAGLW